MDDVTEHWPVKRTLQVELDKIKYMFQASPLPVYVGDRFIKPQNVHAMLKGALVEVSFELRHFCIQKKHKDSFNASVQQVLILQPGKARPCNAYKRRNIFDGPVRACPAPPGSSAENSAGKISNEESDSNEGPSRIQLGGDREYSRARFTSLPPVLTSGPLQLHLDRVLFCAAPLLPLWVRQPFVRVFPGIRMIFSQVICLLCRPR